MSDELIVSNPETLPDADEERFNALEQKIEHTLTGALDAFEEIKRDRLYRARYASFEEYVRERWGQSDRHLRRFLSFFKVKTLLEDVGVSTNGLTERAARELSTGTTPEEQKEIAKDITDHLPWPDDYTPMLPELIETYFTDFVISFRETFTGYSWRVFAKAVSYAFIRIGNDKAEAVKKEKAAAEAMHKLGLQKRVDKMIKDNNQKVDQPSIGDRPLSRKERQAKCSQCPPSIKSMIEQLPVTVTAEDGKAKKVELDLRIHSSSR
jgi:hypothetical protein